MLFYSNICEISKLLLSGKNKIGSCFKKIKHHKNQLSFCWWWCWGAFNFNIKTYNHIDAMLCQEENKLTWEKLKI